MKFILCLGLAASAMLLLAACGSKPAVQSKSTQPATTVSSSQIIDDTTSSAKDSTSQNSTAASKPTAKINEYYTKLTSHKDEFVNVVSQRVEEYRIGTQPDNLNHYEVYPKDYPSAKSLPKVLGINDFIVRQGKNDDAMLGIYIVVKIDETHEMRMDMNEQQATDGSIGWGTGNVYFSHKGDAEFDNWVLESKGEKTWDEFIAEMSSYDITYINQAYSEPETSISDITFQGESGDKIRFSLSSNIKKGDLDIILYDSKGNIVKKLAKADKLVEFLELNYSDTYTLATERNSFVGNFKIAVYKDGAVKLSAWIL